MNVRHPVIAATEEMKYDFVIDLALVPVALYCPWWPVSSLLLAQVLMSPTVDLRNGDKDFSASYTN